MNEVLLLENVTKSFKHKTAVNHVSFSIKKGEVTAILGPNGAGKTTAISMILGLLKPTSGEIKLFNSLPQELHVRQKIGTMLQQVSVMPGLTINEILTLIRSYYPEPLPLKDLVHLTGLTEQDLKTRTEKLSGGQMRRLNFALALAGNPEFMIFDEPTVGMDISSRHQFWQTINTFAAQEKTIIFSTHYLQEADDNARRILLFKDGSIVADGTPQQIKARISMKTLLSSGELLYYVPFLIIMLISPFGVRSMNRRMELERKLDQANQHIAELSYQLVPFETIYQK